MIINGSSSWDEYKIKNLDTAFLENQKVDFFRNSPNSLFDCACQSAKRYPDKVFVFDEAGDFHTFKQIHSDAIGYANLLHKKYGIRKGDRVGLLLDTSYESCALILAVNALGAISVMLPTKYKINEINSLIKKTTPNLIVYSDKFDSLPLFEEKTVKLFNIIKEQRNSINQSIEFNSLCCSDINLEDPAFIIFTSGTTSQGKGAILKNYNVIHAILAYARVLEFSNADSSILCTPIYYVTGLVAIFGLLLFLGGRIYLQAKFKANQVLKTVYDHKITFLHGSPTVFYLLLNERILFPELPSLKMIICGSGNFPKDRILDIQNWLPNVDIRTVYGLTETSSPGTIMPHNAATSSFIGSSGIPIPGLSIKIVDDSENELGEDQHGEIFIKGTNVFNSYYGCDSSPLKNGWFPTGDIGYINSHHYLFVVDRKKNMINRGGEKIWCYDVENELCNIPGIVDAAVVAIPDEKYGEVPVAVVVQNQEHQWSESEIITCLKNRLAGFQVPVRILFLQEIPQTPNLKHNKKEIASLFVSKGK